MLVPLESISAHCNVPGVSASIQLAQNEKEKSMLRLTFSSSLPVGELKGTVALSPVLKGGKLLPAQSMGFYGKIVPDIEAVPPIIQVGGRPIGEVFEEVIVFQSLTGKVLANARVEAVGDGLTLEVIEGKEQYRVRQKVCAEGFQTNYVRFFGEVGERPSSISVPVNYIGIKSE
jgi:hypothetical protein